jgi:signal recognition particle subunit SRP54
VDLGSGIRKALARITGAAVVDERAIKDLVQEIKRTLIDSDVSVSLATEITSRIEKRSLEEKQLKGLSLREHVVRVVYDELVKILGEKYEPKAAKQRIMMYGLYGQGKTTSIGKLAKFFMSKGLKVGVVAGDVHRPAAYEQLEQLAKQVGCGFYGVKGDNDAAKLARDAPAKLSGYDVIVFDSAGRSAFDGELVAELKKVNEAFKPDEKWLVVSADLGQIAGKQAEEFDDAVGITGVVVTKMDGSGKGGGALSSVATSGSKVVFIGTGEKMDALEVFDAQRFAARLLGFPDLPALVEKVRSIAEEEALSKAFETGELNYEGFLAQMKAMKNMGPLKQVFQMLGLVDLPEEMLGKSEEKLKAFETAVLSMTRDERVKPELMHSAARQERIARGSGLKPEEVRELVRDFDRAQKMMKMLTKNRGVAAQLGKLFKGGGGGLAGLGGLGGLGGAGGRRLGR